MRIFDFFFKPADFPYDFDVWKTLPFPQRAKQVCQAWGIQGFGAPPAVILFYTLKIVFYCWMWVFFCSFSDSLGPSKQITNWWFSLEALGKGLFWTILIEVIGLGGASGPLTGRYVPPFGAITYYLRPGTIKIPLFPNLPFLGNDHRNLLDILLYAALLFFLVQACIAPQISPSVVLPVVILLPVLGLLDRQIYLAARADVWFPAIFVFLFPLATGAALKICWFAVWFWAAFSKLTPSFTSVISTMICNSPILNVQSLKKMMFKDYPNDLRLSKTANYIAHFGTVIEFTLPLLLIGSCLFNFPTQLTFYALIGMTAFHTFIFLNYPLGVPMEWNVIMVYGGWVLFGMHPEFALSSAGHPLIIGLFLVSFILLPLLGNFFPKYVSFLMAMRYYAGTWGYSIWLFKHGIKEKKLEPNIVKTSPDVRKQLHMIYDERTTEILMTRAMSFRLMHLPSRALHALFPKAVQNMDDYYWLDGENLAGEVIGWNFGDGHLHHEVLLASIQKRCNFDSEELRVIMVESPQLHNGNIHWRIHDAKDGLLEEGNTSIHDLKDKMPWPL